MKRLTFHEDAKAELTEAVKRYEAEKPGLGKRFRRQFQAAVQRVRENPKAYAVAEERGTRYCPVHKFPFNIVYLELDNRICVIAVAHQKRRPEYWARRNPD